MEFTYYPDKIIFSSEGGSTLAEVVFPAVDADTVNIDHTFIDDSLRGQGVAGRLMEAVANHLQAQNKKAILTCSYAVKWFEKHPEYSGLIKR